ncbi:MAG TPA: glucoamylase family protein [Mesorhizobium sp.]|jgi:hypothetical protein|uniref:glucoamylase family protein n=1 Tax=Mesorhizobium sp. TaxID=1871066 RepID=UPI002DDDA7D7|nr:glucoamylase family protein [Mesorhizobium sp.]HEV2503678.1 glucoamylase family protein [Mesorhizobium sp.]
MDTVSATVSDDDVLDKFQRHALDYFLLQADPVTGLVADRDRPGSPASIAATGMGLAAYAVAAERGWINREEACRRTLTTLRFLWNSRQGPGRDASGHRGFFYHFLDMKTGQRAWNSELSTIDTALLMAGVLVSGLYFDRDGEDEEEIRTLADGLYRRVDWRWALNGGALICHGWKPGRGFLPYRWLGYDEALILYVLALGSPTYGIRPESYSAWLTGYRWKSIYGHEFVYAGPLFIHQFSHLWIDFRGIRDTFMHERGLDYFENSRRATFVQREYAIRNPRGFVGYDQNAWGLTASDGPGRQHQAIDGTRRSFFAYRARGVPFGPDDGTVSPWAAFASLPFAAEIVLPTIRHFHAIEEADPAASGVSASFNPTFRTTQGDGWVSRDKVGINEGPIVMMFENHRSELIWRLLRRCPYVAGGLRSAGFIGGWL